MKCFGRILHLSFQTFTSVHCQNINRITYVLLLRSSRSNGFIYAQLGQHELECEYGTNWGYRLAEYALSGRGSVQFWNGHDQMLVGHQVVLHDERSEAATEICFLLNVNDSLRLTAELHKPQRCRRDSGGGSRRERKCDTLGGIPSRSSRWTTLLW